MNCCSRPFGLLRSLVCLSLLGFAVTVLIGPVLALIGVLLPFALIGGLSWGVYRSGQSLVRRLRHGQRRSVLLDLEPAPKKIDLIPVESVCSTPVRSASRLRSAARAVLLIVVEVGCGAALGAGLAVLIDWQSSANFEHAAMGACIGALVGFVVGGSRTRRSPDGVDENARVASQAA